MNETTKTRGNISILWGDISTASIKDDDDGTDQVFSNHFMNAYTVKIPFPPLHINPPHKLD